MRLDKVIVGVDFSAASLAAARWVSMHLAPRAEVVLVHVLPSPEAPAFVRPYLPSMLDLAEEIAPAIQGGLRGLADMIDPRRVRIDIRTGTPADALAQAAETWRADMICVGRTRARRGSARFGATTAQRLLTRSHVPLLVVPRVPPAHPERILVGVDDAPGSEELLRLAWALSQPWEARVEALHVLPPELLAMVRANRYVEEESDTPPVVGSAAADESTRALIGDEQLLELGRAWLGSMLDGVGAPAARRAVHVLTGDPGQELVALANAASHDLVVVGRGAELARAPERKDAAAGSTLPVGSSARLVMWASPCPVLVLSEARPAPLRSGDRGDRSPRSRRLTHLPDEASPAPIREQHARV